MNSIQTKDSQGLSGTKLSLSNHHYNSSVLSIEMKEMETQSKIKVEYSSKKVYRYLNNFGSLLLITSILVTFAPTIFPSLAPNGWEAIAWVGWGIAIFVLAMIVLVFTNLFKFIFKSDHEDDDSSSGISWPTILKIQLLIVLIVSVFMFFMISNL